MQATKRNAARAILLNQFGEILLMKLHNREMNWEGWITPGGGIETGESDEQAIRRELKEELGLTQFKIGPQVWYRTHTLRWGGQLLEQTEKYFLIKIEKFKPKPLQEPTELERASFEGFKWWSANELKSSNEIFAPQALPKLICEVETITSPVEVG